MGTLERRGEFIEELFRNHDNGIMEKYLPWIKRRFFLYAKNEIGLPDQAALNFSNRLSMELVQMIARTNAEALALIERSLS